MTQDMQMRRYAGYAALPGNEGQSNNHSHQNRHCREHYLLQLVWPCTPSSLILNHTLRNAGNHAGSSSGQHAGSAGVFTSLYTALGGWLVEPSVQDGLATTALDAPQSLSQVT